jgi:hypothetical protein
MKTKLVGLLALLMLFSTPAFAKKSDHTKNHPKKDKTHAKASQDKSKQNHLSNKEKSHPHSDKKGAVDAEKK